jgi:hydroxymethylbilane synthase
MKPLVIGTRASKLAMAQAEMLRDALLRLEPSLDISFAAMTTAGDRELQKDISDWGFKGLFTKELEDALLDGRVDLAVHSSKDLPSMLPEGLVLAGVLPRAEVRDAWVSVKYDSIDALPQGATVGTSSTRRAAQLRFVRPDVNIVPLRGNVDTRLRKLEEGVADATFLAAAGLHRLGYHDRIRSLIPTDMMLPAAAQGAIGIECLATRGDLRDLIARLNHAETFTCITAERAFLLALDGSCRTPIGGLAELREGTLYMRGEVLALDGTVRYYQEITGRPDEAQRLGLALGERLKREAGDDFVKQGQA